MVLSANSVRFWLFTARSLAEIKRHKSFEIKHNLESFSVKNCFRANFERQVFDGINQSRREENVILE